MGLKTVTDGRPVTVFANVKELPNGNKFTTYTIGISSKDKDGNWVNGWIDCMFKRGVTVENKSKINITNSFFTASEYNGKKYTKLFIVDFEIAETPSQAQFGTPSMEGKTDGFMHVPDNADDFLPFQ